MAEMKYKVKYISNTCSQTDELLNKPHQSVAEGLFDLLRNHNEIQHPVVGLEGSWGAGKSQVINILQRLIGEQGLSSKYKFITYDIWGAQEDLTRRSFLDSVLSEVKEDDVHFNTEQLKKDYKQLNATTTIRSTKSFPLVRLFFACILLIPVVNFIVKSIESAFGYNYNASLTYDQLKGWISLGLSILSLFLFIVAYCEERKSVYSDSDVKNKTFWEKFQIIVGRLFYIFKAKDIEKTDYETILKDEPSISRFQNFFDHIYKALKKDSVLVIVFDNMDRLSDSQKVMSTWSLLHTFFAEKEYNGKVWALVPYAQQQLSDLMSVDGKTKAFEFINKTFFTTFRIPEPIMGSWKVFLNDKLDQAFAPCLDDEEKNCVTLIFSRSMTGKTMRPRDIIAYVNRLVALYSQHHFEDVPMRYIALYAQYESEISKSPFDVILNYSEIETLVPLVGKEHLSKWLSSIYYNLPSTYALEVVYDREITKFLQGEFEILGENDEAKEAYQNLSCSELFHHHIEDFFNKDVNLSDYYLEDVFYLLKQDNISQGTRNRIFNIVSNQLDKLKDQLVQYEFWMEYSFLNYDIQDVNRIVKALLRNAEMNGFEEHYMTIVPLLKLQQKRPELRLIFNSYKIESAKNMMDFYEYLVKEDAVDCFKKSKITIDAIKLLEYMKEGVNGHVLFGSNTDNIYGLLQLMKDAKYDLNIIAETIKNFNVSLVNQEHIQVERIYRTYNIVTENKQVVPQYTLIDANGTKFQDIPEYLACTLVCLKNNNCNRNQINGCLLTELKADKDKLNAILPEYISFDFLLKTALSSGNSMLKEICRNLVEDQRCSFQKADNLLSSTSKIINEIFNGESEMLLAFLDSKSVELKDNTEMRFIDVDSYWRENVSKEAIKCHSIFKTICDHWLAEIKGFQEQAWNDVFSGSDVNTSMVIRKLSDIGILGKEFWTCIPKNQVEEAFSSGAVNGTSFDFELFGKWKQNVSKAVLAKLANDTKYKITNPKSIEKSGFVQFVELLWENSELVKDSASANGIFDDFIFDYLSNDTVNHIGEFLYNHQEQVDALVNAISDDRKKLFVDKIKQLIPEMQGETPMLTALEKLLKKHEVSIEEK